MQTIINSSMKALFSEINNLESDKIFTLELISIDKLLDFYLSDFSLINNEIVINNSLIQSNYYKNYKNSYDEDISYLEYQWSKYYINDITNKNEYNHFHCLLNLFIGKKILLKWAYILSNKFPDEIFILILSCEKNTGKNSHIRFYKYRGNNILKDNLEDYNQDGIYIIKTNLLG